MTTCRYINSGQSNFKYEYLGEFKTEFKNILGHESGAQVCSFEGKKQRSKISCYCPFNYALLSPLKDTIFNKIVKQNDSLGKYLPFKVLHAP